MIFFACIKYEESNPETYKGIEVTTLGNPNDAVATFESYDPLQDFQNFVSWTESVGDDNVAYCDSLKHFAQDYKNISEHDASVMLTMVYGDHQDCGDTSFG